MIVLLINEDNGYIYCKDRKFRRSVCFGTPNWTCKFWKRAGFAKRAAERMGLTNYNVVHVYPGDVVNSDGTVSRGVNS